MPDARDDLVERGAEDTSIGGITWHSSDEDSGPDVGISAYLGNGRRLWVGEITSELFAAEGKEHFDSDGGWFLIDYNPKPRLIAKCAGAHVAQEFIEEYAAQATRIQQLTARVEELERERDEARSQRREWQTASALDRATCQAAEASLAEAERVMDYLLGDNSQVHPMFGGCPNIRDLCFTVFMRAHDLNDDDGGPTDWTNDTVPLVNKAITAIRDKAARAWLDSRRKESAQ